MRCVLLFCLGCILICEGTHLFWGIFALCCAFTMRGN